MKNITLLVGTRNRFEDWCMTMLVAAGGTGTFKRTQSRCLIGNMEFIHISRPEQMRGFHGVDVKFMGGFPLDDLKEWEELAASARMP